MDPRTVFLGALTVFASIIFVVTTLPYLTFNPPKSADARPLTQQEERGRVLYASNGCFYCHTQYLRPQDWTGVNSYRTQGEWLKQATTFTWRHLNSAASAPAPICRRKEALILTNGTSRTSSIRDGPHLSP